jgi:hypothetical protein
MFFQKAFLSVILKCSYIHIGWYRDCGLSPQANDVDFGLWINEYDDRLADAFVNNDVVKLVLSFGTPEYGLEMRLTNGEFTFDMFFHYEENLTHSWYPYYDGNNLFKYETLSPQTFSNSFSKHFKLFLRQWIESIELCTGSIQDIRFMVICEPEAYLSKKYLNWTVPLSNYSWKSLLNIDPTNPIKLKTNNLKYYEISVSPSLFPHSLLFLSFFIFVIIVKLIRLLIIRCYYKLFPNLFGENA